MAKTSPSKSDRNSTKPNSKVRKLRKKIKNNKQNLQNQAAAKGIRSYSSRRQQIKKQKKLVTSMLAIAILFASGFLVIAAGWISILFIFNPQQVSWLNDFAPGWVKVGSSTETRPYTFEQIQSEIVKQQLTSGEILALESNTDESFLLPIYRDRNNCQSDCKSIVELRTYHLSTDFEWRSPTEKYYHLTTQFLVTGPEEDEVIAPLVEANAEETAGSSIPLPVTEIGRFDKNAPKPGIWYYLRGDRTSGANQTAYGYVLYYNSDKRNLQQMISWTSPTGDLPQWQQITGDDKQELVVRQTVGLEPRLRVYQVKPTEFILNPIKLSEITLKPPALKDRAYQDALSIAQSGLWTPADEWLQFIKKQQKGKISAAAQAQIDLIGIHSQLTKKLADTSWASPSQQVLADLIDGRWGKALKVFEASPQNTAEIVTLLKADTGRLESRINAALQVNRDRPEVQAWKALIIASQKGTDKAHSWLNTQTKISPDSLTYIKKLLAQT